MTDLEIAKEIIRERVMFAEHGIFNTRNIVGDFMLTIYKGETLQIDICPDYEYFEVFGLSDEDYIKLANYYSELVPTYMKSVWEVI